MDSLIFKKITLNLTHYGIVVVTLEVGRRFVSYIAEWANGKNRKQMYKDYIEDYIQSPFTLMQFFLLTMGYITCLMIFKETREPKDEFNIFSIGLTSILVLVFYTNMHRFLLMTPGFRKNRLRHQLHNIGPGLARGFANMIKVGLKDPKLTSDSLYQYMKNQGIGEFSTRDNQSDFITDKLVIIFPDNLLEYCDKFEDVQKKAEKAKDELQDSDYQWCPVNSQGLKWYDLMVRKQKKEEKMMETAPNLFFQYTMSGNTRSMTYNIMTWTYKDNGSTKTSYFKSFDNKPLENLIDWYKENSKLKKLSQTDYQDQNDLRREVQRQCDLYRECLERELDSDPNCKDNYYILTFNDTLSVAMLDLEQMIKEREKKVGLKWKNN